MMRKTAALALIALFCLSGTAFAQTDITDIQVYDALGAPASPYDTLPVTVRGVVTVLKGTYNGGTHYVEDPTGGIQFYSTTAPTLALGDSIEVSGTVSAFAGEIQIGSPSITFLGVSDEIVPLELDVSQAKDYDNSGGVTAGDYELVGRLVAVTGTVTTANAATAWGLYTGTDTIDVYIDSDTGIDDSAVNDGDIYRVVSPMVNFNGLLELKPRQPTDLIENPGDPFPQISAVTPAPWTPVANEAVTIQATITDAGGAVNAANLYYAYGGSGSFTMVAMTNVFADVYEAVIPGTTAASIQYYLEATDNSAQTTLQPGDAPTSSNYLAVGTTPISVIQSTLDGTGGTALAGEIHNVEGIVTMQPGELNATGSQWIIEDSEGGPWSGLFVFEGSGGNVLFRGDRVRIAGTVNEFSNTTQIIPLRADAVEVVSFGNPLPPIEAFTSTELDTTEALENVIVRSFMSTVQDTIPASDNFTMIDTVSDSTVTVDPQFAVSIAPLPGETMIVTGLLDGRFGVFELSPRDDDDFRLFATGVEDGGSPQIRRATVDRVHPNPFNPRTEIEFSVPRKGMTELAVFNVRGERVRTLFQGVLDAGTHVQAWNGKDGTGADVASGVYYMRLRFETESASVVKATLLK